MMESKHSNHPVDIESKANTRLSYLDERTLIQQQPCDSTASFSVGSDQGSVIITPMSGGGNGYDGEDEGEMRGGRGSNGDSTSSSIVVGSGGSGHMCVVCGDDSDGLHFGQFTCRACAAFFRRTVSLKLQYTCKHEGHCEIERSEFWFWGLNWGIPTPTHAHSSLGCRCAKYVPLVPLQQVHPDGHAHHSCTALT